MPLYYQKFITREDIQNNRDKLYLFGDNECRVGNGGQAFHMRWEPNSIGIATKKTPNHNNTSYWSDSDYGRCCAIVDADMTPAFVAVLQGRTVVCPTDGLGTGLSRLPEKAPAVLRHIERRLAELAQVGLPR